jgi:hypothetical protein
MSEENNLKRVICLFIVFLSLLVTTANAENNIVKQPREAGVKHCLPAIEKISTFLIEDGDTGAQSNWNSEHPDLYPFSTVIERNYDDGPVVINLNIAPLATGQCYVEYEKIIQFQESCLAVSHRFKGAEYVGELNREVAALKQEAVNIFLIPSGPNCIAVLKEIVMDGLVE